MQSKAAALNLNEQHQTLLSVMGQGYLDFYP